MTATFHYISDAPNAFDVTLDKVKRVDTILVQSADHGQVGIGKIVIQDPTGTAGNSSDAILGLKKITAVQSACTPSRMLTGYFAEREYERGDWTTAAGRDITASILDLNARLQFRAITGTDGKRPAESVSARMIWLLASAYLTGLVYDAGEVDYPSTVLEKANYKNRFPGDVLADMALKTRLQFHVYYDDGTDHAALWFKDMNTSTDQSSTLSISNVKADIDNSTVFAPARNSKLKRDPQRVVAGAVVPYTGGSVYVTRSATADTYAWRDRVAPNADTKSAAVAKRLGNAFLRENKTEEDLITTQIRLPAAKVNLVRAGQRIQVKFSHFPGYASYVWCRILECKIRHPFEMDQIYDLELKLSPQEGTFLTEYCGPDALGGVWKGPYPSTTVVPPFVVTSGSPVYTYTPNASLPTATVQWDNKPTRYYGATSAPWDVEGTFDSGTMYWGLKGGTGKNLDLFLLRYVVDLGTPTEIGSALIAKHGVMPNGSPEYNGHPFGYAKHTTDGYTKVRVRGSNDGASWTTLADYDKVYASVIPGTAAYSALISIANVPIPGATYRYFALEFEKKLSDGGFAGFIGVDANIGKFYAFSLCTPGAC